MPDGEKKGVTLDGSRYPVGPEGIPLTLRVVRLPPEVPLTRGRRAMARGVGVFTLEPLLRPVLESHFTPTGRLDTTPEVRL